MTFTTMLRGAFAALAALSLAACGINSVPTKEEAAKAGLEVIESVATKSAEVQGAARALVGGAAEVTREPEADDLCVLGVRFPLSIAHSQSLRISSSLWLM